MWTGTPTGTGTGTLTGTHGRTIMDEDLKPRQVLRVVTNSDDAANHHNHSIPHFHHANDNLNDDQQETVEELTEVLKKATAAEGTDGANSTAAELLNLLRL